MDITWILYLTAENTFHCQNLKSHIFCKSKKKSKTEVSIWDIYLTKWKKITVISIAKFATEKSWPFSETNKCSY